MRQTIQLKTTVPPISSSMNRPPWWRVFLLIPLMVASLGLSRIAQAADGDLGNGNTSEGADALQSLTTGIHNTADGYFTLHSNTTGDYNTATGSEALANNNFGFRNTANGFQALAFNTSGDDNTAIGWRALFSNMTNSVFSGNNNTASGSQALFNNTIGSSNTAAGAGALYSNTNGTANTATGANALGKNIDGDFNTAAGASALGNNTGAQNTATGFEALGKNIDANFNTATGSSALGNNTTGTNNTANGFDALFSNNGTNNTADGVNALLHNTTGSGNIALGVNAGQNLTTGSNNIVIGTAGVAGDAGKIRIGTIGTQTATFVAGIFGVAVPNGLAVVVDTNGHLGTVASSQRFKADIKPMAKASEAILALKPVTFHYKKDIDPKGIPQFGLVAEEVEKVNPDLVARDAKGNVYTVRYEAVNAMLLNEFLKEHRKVEALQASFTQQQKDFQATVVQLTARLNEQAAQIRKVSTQLAIQKSAPQMVLNNQ